MKNALFKFYLLVGAAACMWFATAAFAGWKGPDFQSTFRSSSSGFGRSYGGYWGGGK